MRLTPIAQLELLAAIASPSGIDESAITLQKQVEVPPAREAELRAWAAAVLARPWPRWR